MHQEVVVRVTKRTDHAVVKITDERLRQMASFLPPNQDLNSPSERLLDHNMLKIPLR